MGTDEWWLPVFKHGLWVAAMALIMGWLGRSRLRARSLSDARSLRYPAAYLFVAFMCLAFFGACAILSNLYPNATTTWWTTAIFVGFAVFSAGLILECIIARHSVSDAGLAYRRWPGTLHSLQWRELRSVRYAPVLKWFRLETRNGDVAHVSAMLTGLPEFARLVLAHAPPGTIEKKTLPILVATADGHPPAIWA